MVEKRILVPIDEKGLYKAEANRRKRKTVIKNRKAFKKLSLRTILQDGVAIPKVFCSVIDAFFFCLGDSHTSVRTGSE